MITEEDMKLLEKGGYSISESSEDFGMSHDSYVIQLIIIYWNKL